MSDPFTIDTPFSHMPIGRRNHWLAWAASHDWGSKPAHYVADTGEICTWGACKDDCGDWYDEPAYHKTPREMRNWAGY